MAPAGPIRPAVPVDAGAIAAVHVSAWRAAYPGLMPQPLLDGLSVEDHERGWRRILSEPGPATTIVAEYDGAVRGFAVYGPSRDEDATGQPVGELIALNVDPACWRRGLGRALTETVIAASHRRRWDRLTLWVVKGNARAQTLYSRLGFAPDGAEKTDATHDGAPIYEVRYRKYLAGNRD